MRWVTRSGSDQGPRATTTPVMGPLAQRFPILPIPAESRKVARLGPDTWSGPQGHRDAEGSRRYPAAWVTRLSLRSPQIGTHSRLLAGYVTTSIAASSVAEYVTAYGDPSGSRYRLLASRPASTGSNPRSSMRCMTAS